MQFWSSSRSYSAINVSIVLLLTIFIGCCEHKILNALEALFMQKVFKDTQDVISSISDSHRLTLLDSLGQHVLEYLFFVQDLPIWLLSCIVFNSKYLFKLFLFIIWPSAVFFNDEVLCDNVISQTQEVLFLNGNCIISYIFLAGLYHMFVNFTPDWKLHRQEATRTREDDNWDRKNFSFDSVWKFVSDESPWTHQYCEKMDYICSVAGGSEYDFSIVRRGS